MEGKSQVAFKKEKPVVNEYHILDPCVVTWFNGGGGEGYIGKVVTKRLWCIAQIHWETSEFNPVSLSRKGIY